MDFFTKALIKLFLSSLLTFKFVLRTPETERKQKTKNDQSSLGDDDSGDQERQLRCLQLIRSYLELWRSKL
ncbi:unnamed protein product [Linum trigynum]|uniref:Uncharacterized protein n=1 Tax=Linum trigynum TaxID=586398 RepID=A0AAV2DD18_9ROSI